MAWSWENTVYASGCPRWLKWLPRSLELLFGFGGRKGVDVDEQLRCVSQRQAYTEETHLMELLADKPDADKERNTGDLGWLTKTSHHFFLASRYNP